MPLLPDLAMVYGLRPADVRALTPEEFGYFRAHLEHLQQMRGGEHGG